MPAPTADAKKMLAEHEPNGNQLPETPPPVPAELFTRSLDRKIIKVSITLVAWVVSRNLERKMGNMERYHD